MQKILIQKFLDLKNFTAQKIIIQKFLKDFIITNNNSNKININFNNNSVISKIH